MAYKFEQLEVWRMGLDYADMMYALLEKLPASEDFNLKSQLRRAATSIPLNIAEGSTSQSDPEQARFASLAIRSLLETVACQYMIHRRGYMSNSGYLREVYQVSEKLFAKPQAFRNALQSRSLQEEPGDYSDDLEVPF